MSNRTNTYYAATGAQSGYGTQLMVGNGASPETFEAIAGVVSIQPGDMSTADILRTHLRSPDAHQEHMPGLRDSGAFNVEGIWLPTEESQSNAGGGSGSFTAGGLVAIWRARTTRNFRIVLPDATIWPFTAYVSQFQPGSITNDDKIDFTAGFQPTQAYDASLP